MNDELERLMKEATIKGQLRLRDDGDCYVILDEDDQWLMCNTSYYPSAPGWEDAALIVAAVNALPGLVAKVKRLEAENTTLKDLCLAAGDLYKGGGVFPIKGTMALRLLKAGAALNQEGGE